MTDDEIARLMNAAAGEHWGTEMHFRRFAYALLAAERAKRDALLEALNDCVPYVVHYRAKSFSIEAYRTEMQARAAIKAVEENT